MNTLCPQQSGHLSPATNDKVLVQAQTTNLRQRITRTALVRSLRKIKQAMLTRYEQRIDRQAFEHINKLDDHMLKDIGVTRLDVKWASRLPLSEDAAARLEIIARRKK